MSVFVLGNNLDMIVFIPNEIGNFSQFEQTQTPVLVDHVMAKTYAKSGKLKPRSCHVSFPKFSIEHQISDLKSIMESMGVRDIFEPGTGDFSPMTSSDQIHVNQVDHKAVIDVNKSGIKAAASTGITISQRMTPSRVVVDKPFVFYIRQRSTGAILFLGRFVRPQFSNK